MALVCLLLIAACSQRRYGHVKKVRVGEKAEPIAKHNLNKKKSFTPLSFKSPGDSLFYDRGSSQVILKQPGNTSLRERKTPGIPGKRSAERKAKEAISTHSSSPVTNFRTFNWVPSDLTGVDTVDEIIVLSIFFTLLLFVTAVVGGGLLAGAYYITGFALIFSAEFYATHLLLFLSILGGLMIAKWYSLVLYSWESFLEVADDYNSLTRREQITQSLYTFGVWLLLLIPATLVIFIPGINIFLLGYTLVPGFVLLRLLYFLFRPKREGE